MNKLPKSFGSELHIVKEFARTPREDAGGPGRMIVRATNYGSHLDRFDKLFAIMAADAATCEPPIELDRNDAEVVHYGGERYAHTFGLEVQIPGGYIVPEDYTRIDRVEPTL